MNEDPTVLLSPLGREILARLAEESARAGASPASSAGARQPDLALAVRLRREYPPNLVAAAMAQQELRLAARAKFGRAMRMLFTRDGYEQSSSEMIAGHRAARFSGAGRLADLCCGIGGDLIALASRADQVLAVDANEVHARLALHNAGVYEVAEGVRACVADVRDIPLSATGIDAVFIDPARRSGQPSGTQSSPRSGTQPSPRPGTQPGARSGTQPSPRPGTQPGARRFRAGTSEPPLDWCLSLPERVPSAPAVCVKAAPGLPAELIPAGWEAEFIADGRDLKEAVLWSPALATAPRRATILPGGDTLAADPRAAGDPVPVGEPGEYLLDPNPAVTRAGLVEDLARMLGAWKLDPLIAFLAVPRDVRTPFARTLRVVESAPWNEKRFAGRLRDLGVGAADLRRRGLAGDVEQIHRRLKLAGPHRATVVLTRVSDRPWGLICADPGSPLG
jgi:THUMP domain-like/RNA cap guanine-N2 methyltransferase